jgi:hypothetical protein
VRLSRLDSADFTSQRSHGFARIALGRTHQAIRVPDSELPLNTGVFPGQAQYLNGKPPVGGVSMTVKSSMKQHVAGFNGEATRKTAFDKRPPQYDGRLTCEMPVPRKHGTGRDRLYTKPYR